jgi:hypothetical protein
MGKYMQEIAKITEFDVPEHRKNSNQGEGALASPEWPKKELIKERMRILLA